MNDELIPSNQERICPECNRKFTPTSQWAYKINTKGKYIYLCRYNCHRAAEKRLESKTRRVKELKSKKPSKEQLERDLRAGLSISDIARIYGASAQSVKLWIKAYGLEGVKEIEKPWAGEQLTESTPTTGRSRIPMTSGIGVAYQGPINAIEPLAEPTQVENSETVQSSPTTAEIEQFHTDVEVQELSKVEGEPAIGKSFGCFSDYDLSNALCNLCSVKAECRGASVGMTEEENMTDAEWEAQEKPKIEFACFGAYDADYRGCNPSLCAVYEECRNKTVSAPDDGVNRAHQSSEPFAEVWQDVRDDITTLRRCYHKQADDDFRSHLLELVREVMGERDLIGK